MRKLDELARKDGITPAERFGLANLNGDPFFEVILEAVGLLHDGLKTYGKPVDGQADVFYMVLKAKKVKVNEIILAVERWLSGDYGEDYPTPGRFAETIVELRVDLERQELLAAAAEEAKLDQERACERFRDRHGITGETPREKIREIAKSIIDRVFAPTVGSGRPDGASLRNDHTADESKMAAREEFMRRAEAQARNQI